MKLAAAGAIYVCQLLKGLTLSVYVVARAVRVRTGRLGVYVVVH